MKQLTSNHPNGRRVLLSALAAGLVLGTLVLQFTAPAIHADCISLNGVTLSSGNADGSCLTTVSGNGAAAVQSSSINTSTNGSSTSSSTVVSSSSDGSATAIAQSSDGSANAPLVIQSSDQSSDATAGTPAACPPLAAGGQTMILGPATLCMSSALPQPATPAAPAAAALAVPQPGAISFSGNAGACGTPSMVIGPAGISMSSGAC